MSIWCSDETIGWEDDGFVTIDGKTAHVTCNGGQVRSYAEGWSNHYPTTDDKVEQRASITLADIPAWCAGGLYDDYESVGEWLRLTIDSAKHDYYNPTDITRIKKVNISIVIDEAAARMLVSQLSKWIDSPKLHKSY